MANNILCARTGSVRWPHLLALSLLLLLLPQFSLQAATPLAPADRMLVLCNRFADLSVQWAQKALVEECPIALIDKPGSPWSINEDNHYQWCLAQKNESMLNARLAARQAEYATCIAEKAEVKKAAAARPDNQSCFLYARQAFDMAGEAQALQCGFTGKRWLADFSHHKSQCVKLMTVNNIEFETEQRRRALQQCEAMRNVPIKKQ